MSHYAVGVITKEYPTEEVLAEALAPFDESIQVEPYIYMTKAQIIEENKEWAERIKKNVEEGRSSADDPYCAKFLKAKTDEDFYNCEPHEVDDLWDAEGNLLSTYNPKSRWDWWCVGGRFSEKEDIQKLKEYKVKLHKDDGLEDSQLKLLYPKQYDHYDRMIKDEPGASMYSSEYIKKIYPTFSDYMRGADLYSILTPDGEWLEAGKMGWWGISAAEDEDKINWDKNFVKLIDSFDDDYYITVVDCHI